MKRILTGSLLALSVMAFAPLAQAKPKVPKGVPQPPIVQDLPPPLNLQMQVVKKSATVSWKWISPDPVPAFTEFGFEIERENGPSWITADLSLADFGVDVGTYTYRVRARGVSKQGGKRVSNTSRWVGPILAEIVPVCPDPPEVTVKVEPVQREYSRTPTLRLKISGVAKNPKECHSLRASYTVDSGTGLHRTGVLNISDAGVINEFINAVDEGDELVAGGMTFNVSVTVENEAGPMTPGTTTLSLQTENPYAPKEPF